MYPYTPGMHIGERIRRARTKAGIEIDDLARKLKLTGEAVRSWERGDTAPRPARYKKIADALGTTEAYIASGVRSDTDQAEYDERTERFGSIMERLSEEQFELLVLVAQEFSRER